MGCTKTLIWPVITGALFRLKYVFLRTPPDFPLLLPSEPISSEDLIPSRVTDTP